MVSKYCAISGIMPALITVYDQWGRLNLKELVRILEFQIDAQVNGFFVCGSTGEGLLLSKEERKLLLKSVIEVVGSRVKVVVHVGAVNTKTACELAAHAEGLGADAVAAIPQVYYRLDEDAIYEHYRLIGQASTLPLWIYHIPKLTGFGVTPDFFQRCLDGIPTFGGIKFSDLDLELLQRFVDLGDDRITYMSGLDQILFPALVMGASGGIGTNYNHMPHRFVDLYRKYQQGDLKGAQFEQHEINKILGVLRKYSTIRCVKTIMKFLGYDCGQPRRPLRGLNKDEEEELLAALKSSGYFDYPNNCVGT